MQLVFLAILEHQVAAVLLELLVDLEQQVRKVSLVHQVLQAHQEGSDQLVHLGQLVLLVLLVEWVLQVLLDRLVL